MTDTSFDDVRNRIIGALRTVHDPEIPVNIYDLGLIYDIDIPPEGAIKVKMTLTSPSCPVAEELPGKVEQAVMSQADGRDVNVELVWEPPWTQDRMSEAAQLELGL